MDIQPLRQIAVIADELDLVRILRERLDELNVSRSELDIEAKLTSGHSSKLLCLPPIKYFGMKSFWNVLEAVGYAVIIVEDPAATKRYAERMAKREINHVRRRSRALALSGRIPWLITKENAAKLGSKGGKNSLPKRSLRSRKKLSKMANQIRWNAVKQAVRP